MIYLVDADVLSEPTRPAPSSKVIDWLGANEQDIVVYSLILGELYIGILALPRGRKRIQLEQWFDALVRTVDCLPWDATIARRWALLVVDLRRRGEPLPLLDGMIAATALHHDLTIATRNTRDFKRAGVKVLNPFE
jgi:predicted nucleic acid-binding protein